MAKFELPVIETDFYPFRRWLKARDPDATIAFEPVEDELWLVSVTTTKAYLPRLSERRWRAREALPPATALHSEKNRLRRL